MNRNLLLAGCALVIVGLVGSLIVSSFAIPGGPAAQFPASSPESLGEQIYYTATGSGGRPIPYARGARFLAMMGGSCVNCHGEDGKGGFPIMMTSEEAPDIRYQSLKAEGMTDRDIERAIRDGIDEEGNELSPIMPRWQMNDEELQAIIAYLKSLE